MTNSDQHKSYEIFWHNLEKTNFDQRREIFLPNSLQVHYPVYFWRWTKMHQQRSRLAWPEFCEQTDQSCITIKGWCVPIKYFFHPCCRGRRHLRCSIYLIRTVTCRLVIWISMWSGVSNMSGISIAPVKFSESATSIIGKVFEFESVRTSGRVCLGSFHMKTPCHIVGTAFIHI